MLCDLSAKLSKFTKSQLFSLKNPVHPGQFWVLFFKFVQLYITVILFSSWDKSHDPGANWSKLDHPTLHSKRSKGFSFFCQPNVTFLMCKWCQGKTLEASKHLTGSIVLPALTLTGPMFWWYFSPEAFENLVLNMTWFLMLIFWGFFWDVQLLCSSKFEDFRNNETYWLKKSENLDNFLKSLFFDLQECIISQNNPQKNYHSILK